MPRGRFQAATVERFQRAGRALGAHAVAGLAAALGCSLVDLAFALGRAREARPHGFALLLSITCDLALLVPWGVGIGLAIGALDALTRPPLTVRAAFRAYLAPQAWLLRAPEGVGFAILAALLGTAYVATVHRILLALHPVIHRPANLGWLVGAAALGAATIFALVHRTIAPAFERVVDRVPLLARPIVSIALVAVPAVAFVQRSSSSLAETLRAVDGFYAAGLAAGALAHGASIARQARLESGTRTPFRTIGTVLSIAVLSIAFSGLGYGRMQSQRTLIEDWSRAASLSLRALRRVSDRDGDGYSSFFGGGDCDDRRADVHPDAFDRKGDGVDCDCFDGDGTGSYDVLGDGRPGPYPLSGLREPNVLLVTVDTLRPDRLGCYGYRERPTSPNIDAFCREAVVFRHASAQAPRSVRSIPALLTGMYPTQIPFGPENVFPSISDSATTFAEILPPRYRATADVGTRYFSSVPGLFQGFDEVRASTEYKPPRGEVVDWAIERMRAMVAARTPFVEWVHLFSVHEPRLWDRRRSPFGDDDEGAYDAEVAFVDRELGRLFRFLRESGLRGNTVVILASDHGEALGEHGYFEHGSSVYEEQIGSVLVVAAPGVGHREVDVPVGLFDVAPTVANVVGARFPAPLAAQSLVPYLVGETRPRDARPLFAEVVPDGAFPSDMRMIRRADEKLVYFPQSNRFQLFDLAHDPHELVDRSDVDRGRAADLLRTLRRFIHTTHHGIFDREAQIRDAITSSMPPRSIRATPTRFAGSIAFLGHDLTTPLVERGRQVRFSLYFRAESATLQDLYVDVIPDPPYGFGMRPDFRLGHFPVNGAYRTQRWLPGQIIRDTVVMTVPPDMPAPLRIRYALRLLDRGNPVAAETGGTVGTQIDLFELAIE
ncbi:MAG: sulfatase-like hydrolase/transferase [Polyangiales bacterium]